MPQAHNTVLCSLNSFSGSGIIADIVTHAFYASGLASQFLRCALQDLVADGLLWQDGNVVGLTELGEKEVA